MKSPLFEHAAYQKVITDMKELEKTISKMEATKKYDSHYLMSKKQEAENAVKNDLNTFYENRVKEIDGEMQQIAESYKKDYYENIDTQKELLRRQDIERKLKLSSDDELKARVEEFKKSGEGEKVELEMLQLALKERGLGEAHIHLKAYIDHYEINTPHTKDTKYQSLSEELGLLYAVKRSKLFYVDNGSGDYQPYSPSYFKD